MELSELSEYLSSKLDSDIQVKSLYLANIGCLKMLQEEHKMEDLSMKSKSAQCECCCSKEGAKTCRISEIKLDQVLKEISYFSNIEIVEKNSSQDVFPSSVGLLLDSNIYSFDVKLPERYQRFKEAAGLSEEVCCVEDFFVVTNGSGFVLVTEMDSYSRATFAQEYAALLGGIEEIDFAAMSPNPMHIDFYFVVTEYSDQNIYVDVEHLSIFLFIREKEDISKIAVDFYNDVESILRYFYRIRLLREELEFLLGKLQYSFDELIRASSDLNNANAICKLFKVKNCKAKLLNVYENLVLYEKNRSMYISDSRYCLEQMRHPLFTDFSTYLDEFTSVTDKVDYPLNFFVSELTSQEASYRAATVAILISVLTTLLTAGIWEKIYP